ncbi:hypothetical protein [Actinoplanes subtropicus]|nr:hypothetical protein [Actinoplanes subtropicus]
MQFYGGPPTQQTRVLRQPSNRLSIIAFVLAALSLLFPPIVVRLSLL